MVRGLGEVEGRAAIREAMATLLGDTTVTFAWEPVRADIGSGGDLGYTVGRYEIRSTVPDTAAGEGSGREGTPGEPPEPTGPGDAGALLGHGMYLSVWERQPDGSWKVAADIGSPAPLPEEAVEVGEAGADAGP